MHGKGLLSADVHILGMHLLVRPSLKFAAFLKDQTCL